MVDNLSSSGTFAWWSFGLGTLLVELFTRPKIASSRNRYNKYVGFEGKMDKLAIDRSLDGCKNVEGIEA